VVEILSPSNANYDLLTKRELYRRCGVPEYWIVFPDEHKILQLTLDAQGRYQEQVETIGITMAMPPHAVVDLSKVWNVS
jgi:Uma2 family endonuclease